MSRSPRPSWTDPGAFAVNRRRGRALLDRYDSLEDLDAGRRSNRLDLAGTWDFQWVEGLAGFDGHAAAAAGPQGGGRIRVPALWQLEGHGVPIYLANTYPPAIDRRRIPNIDQARNTPDQVLDQIISDLLLAEEKLPATYVTGRAGSFSATALLARVYLAAYHYGNDPDDAAQAIAKAGKVIDEGGYSLAPAYGDLFNGNTTESIFEIVFDVQNRNVLAQYFFPRSLTGRYEVAPT